MPIPDTTKSDLVGMWRSVSKGIDLEKKKAMEEFISCICNPSRKYGGSRVPYYTGLAKRLLGGIFDELSKVSDEQAAIAKVNELCEGLDRSLDKQIPGMMFLYHVLTKDAKEDGLEEFVRWEEEQVFDLTVAPPLHGSQGGAILDFWMDVLSFWKHRLRDEVGFDLEFRISAVHECSDELDGFNGWPGNVVRAFYAKLTPEYIVGKVTEQINSRSRMVYEAVLLDEGKSVYVSSRDTATADGVTKEFVKHLLLEMGIIVERKPLVWRCLAKVSGVLWKFVSCDWKSILK